MLGLDTNVSVSSHSCKMLVLVQRVRQEAGRMSGVSVASSIDRPISRQPSRSNLGPSLGLQHAPSHSSGSEEVFYLPAWPVRIGSECACHASVLEIFRHTPAFCLCIHRGHPLLQHLQTCYRAAKQALQQRRQIECQGLS